MSNKINHASMLRMGTILRGIYRIDRYLSSGGFGNTYVATNVEFNEVVAIKEFFIKGVTQRDANNTTVSVSNSDNNDLFNSQLKKFKKEARRIRKLKNDHIVLVHDLFEENGTAYYVMDYIDGESLSERMDRLQRPLTENEVLRYYPQILDALHTIHQQGIFHLDLKPGNVMVDTHENVKLIDFGASKQQSNAQDGARETNSTLICYTNGYAPREQMERNFEKIGPWTDIYALGATIYALLTHQRPLMPSDIDDDRTHDKHLALPLPDEVSDEMRDLILKLMKTDRMARPQSVEELDEDDEEETVFGPESLKEFEGWKEKIAGSDYYKGYYSAVSIALEKMGKAKSNADVLAAKQEAKEAYAELLESANLYKKFFGLEDLKNQDRYAYNWSLIDDKLNRRDTSMNNKDLKALIAKFEASQEPIKGKKGGGKRYNKQILLSVLAAIIGFSLIYSFLKPHHDESINEEEAVLVDSVETVQEVVDDMIYSIPTMGEGTYTGAIDDDRRPHDSEGVFKSEKNNIEYKGAFVHGVAEGKASYKIQNQTFEGTFKNNEYDNGTLTLHRNGSYFKGSFKSGQPYNGVWYTKSGKIDAKVVKGIEMK